MQSGLRFFELSLSFTPMRSLVFRLLGLPFVLLALAVQIGVGAIVLQPQLMELAALSQTSLICHAGTPANDQSPAAPRHAPCMLCPLCAAVATAGHVLTGAEPPLPAPRLVFAFVREGMPPPATAPPTAPATAAQPRGPPVLA